MFFQLIAQKIDNPALGSGLAGTSGWSYVQRLVTSLVGLLTVVAGFVFLFMFLSGAIGIITSGGDKAAYETARKRITYGIIGLVVVIAAIFVTDLITTFLGVPDILNINAMLNVIKI